METLMKQNPFMRTLNMPRKIRQSKCQKHSGIILQGADWHQRQMTSRWIPFFKTLKYRIPIWGFRVTRLTLPSSHIEVTNCLRQVDYVSDIFTLKLFHLKFHNQFLFLHFFCFKHLAPLMTLLCLRLLKLGWRSRLCNVRNKTDTNGGLRREIKEKHFCKVNWTDRRSEVFEEK